MRGWGTKFWWKNQIHTSIIILYAIDKKSPTPKMPTCGQTSLPFVSTLQTLTLIPLHFDNVHMRGKVLTPTCPHMVLGVFLGANFYHMVTKKIQWDSYKGFCEMNMPKLQNFKEGFYPLKFVVFRQYFWAVIEI